MEKPTHFYVKAPTGQVWLRYKGVWDMDDLYKKMADWFRSRKYNFYEKAFKHKAPTAFGRERQYNWTGERKEEEYYKFVIEIYMHTYDAQDIEVKNQDGSTKIMTKGRIWIEFKGNIDFDYEKRFQDEKFFANLRNFYNKYIIKKRVEHILWDQLWYREIQKLYELVMDTLNMYSREHEHRYWTGVHI
ncbi:MAG TPA: hypothetical protein VJI46_04940 [Candidatus Nanoarchaeia archaeon]|nr:hypothetical protein [Candidatus Nanoarchaeia archaeon]